MKYRTLKQIEQDKMIVQTLQQQELDYFIHTTNLNRYKKLLEETNNDEWKEDLKKHIAEIEYQLEKVETIMKVLEGELPSEGRIKKALRKLK